MTYILFSKGVEQFDVNGKSLGIGDDRAVYYSKNIGRGRAYRHEFPATNPAFELLDFDTLKDAEDQMNHVNAMCGDNFIVIEQ